ncbi:MAG: methyltransferase domain-containing protein [Casimicrobiaceae bacterium]
MPKFPVSPNIRGIGLSDANAYARGLADRFDYVNTYFDREPRLDICKPDRAFLGANDFVIASDVFEHIEAPVATAFRNLRELLKPNGIVVFTVPFSFAEHTTEHFPDLFEWRLVDVGDGKVAVENRTRDGRLQRFADVVMHHGPGMTLEMREFSHDALLSEFSAAGFDRVTVERRPCFDYGIYWRVPWSVTISARAPR